MARKEETKTCHACRETLKWDWEVCPFCGASQEDFDDAGIVGRDDRPPGPAVEYEPAENERVDRLPPKPLPATPLRPDSIPAEDALYAVMRLSMKRVNIPELGRGLSAILDRPLADVTCRIQAAKGFLARHVPQSKLAAVAHLMDELGVEVGVVREEDVVPLPPAYRTPEVGRADPSSHTGSVPPARLTAGPAAVRLTCAATSPSEKTWQLTFAPDQVKLIVTGRVMYTARLSVEKPVFDPYKNSALFKKRYVKPEHSRKIVQREFHGYDYLIHLFLTRPERLLLIKDAGIDYDRMERLESRPERMRAQAELLARVIEPSLHDDALRLLAWLDEDDPHWTPFTFATQKGFETYAESCYNLSLIQR